MEIILLAAAVAADAVLFVCMVTMPGNEVLALVSNMVRRMVCNHARDTSCSRALNYFLLE